MQNRRFIGPGKEESQRKKKGTLGWGWGAWGQACYRCFITYVLSFIQDRNTHFPLRLSQTSKDCSEAESKDSLGLTDWMSCSPWGSFIEIMQISILILYPPFSNLIPTLGQLCSSPVQKADQGTMQITQYFPPDPLKRREEATQEPWESGRPEQLSPGTWAVFFKILPKRYISVQ